MSDHAGIMRHFHFPFAILRLSFVIAGRMWFRQ
jgi:hypothetical protein